MKLRPLLDREPYCAAVGLVAMEWSALEDAVQRLHWSLAGLRPNLGRCVTQHIPFGTLWDSILALASELGLPAAQHKELVNLQARCEPLRIQRNDVVHGLWGITPGTNLAKGELSTIVTKARRKLKVEVRHPTLESMHALASQIVELTSAVSSQVVPPPNNADA